MSEVPRAQRHEVELDVEVVVAGAGETRYACKTRNLSLGGAFIAGPATLRPAFGARLELRLTLPGGKDRVVAGAIVRWSNDDGFAVQFDGLRARDVWALGKFLEK